MNLEDVIAHCMSKADTEETTPFGPDVLVYKVGGKMFALASPDDVPPSVNLKCDPERSILLRDEFSAITPGYHMNKRHWNTVVLDGSVPSALIRELIEHSYALVLPRREKERGG
jgi:predicted DNA-binding protein (MmcQ/YjbR family)